MTAFSHELEWEERVVPRQFRYSIGCFVLSCCYTLKIKETEQATGRQDTMGVLEPKEHIQAMVQRIAKPDTMSALEPEVCPGNGKGDS